MCKKHGLEIYEETIEERAKPELRYCIEIIERLHAAEIDREEIGVVVKRPCEIAPLNGQSVYYRLVASLGLSPNLQGKINQGRNSNNYTRQLTDRAHHLPAHMLLAFDSWF